MQAVAGGVYVLPYFPHRENKEEGEARWVILLENHISTVLIVPLTKQVHQIKHYPKSFLIKKDSAEGRQMGLLHDSLVLVERVTDMSHFVISKATQKGVCPDEILDKIQELITTN